MTPVRCTGKGRIEEQQVRLENERFDWISGDHGQRNFNSSIHVNRWTEQHK
jgi:hypothetical protein